METDWRLVRHRWHHEQQLTEILGGSRWFIEVLEVVRACDLPEWAVGAGVIRNLVWDHLHGLASKTHAKDVDVAFFDTGDISRERDKAIERELRARMPSVPWEVTNQAGVHVWYESVFGYPIPAARSVEDAVGMWPETATSVAVRLEWDETLRVIAPVGLNDLLGLVLRRNPRQITREYFLQRLREKRVPERWPCVQIVHE
jgi:hypothetical protein